MITSFFISKPPLQQIINERNGDITEFTYDPWDNLVSATYEQHQQLLTIYKAPDAIGNLFETQNQTDRKYQSAQLQTDGKWYYYYDKEGNLIQKSPCKLHNEKNAQKWSLGVWQYTWNANGSLKSVKKPSGQTISFEYDALGRRTKKFVKDKTIHYIWSGNVLLHEIFDNGNEQKTATYVYEQENFVPSAKLVDNESFSIVSDYIGRPIQVYDQNGDSVWSADYDIYGKLINLQGDKSFIPFRQLGQYEDVETGLYYNRFRYYDPNSGLYISQDPIGLFGNNPNIYAYVFDSNTEVDVLGLIILKNPKIRNNTKIFGKGQNTGLGHAQVMENLAEQLADTGKYKEIYLNRSWNTAIHTSTGVKGNISDLRPDLILIDKNDKFYSIEVASKTDDLVSLNVRNINVLSQLGQSKNHYGHIKYGDYDALGKIKNKKGIKHLH